MNTYLLEEGNIWNHIQHCSGASPVLWLGAQGTISGATTQTWVGLKQSNCLTFSLVYIIYSE